VHHQWEHSNWGARYLWAIWRRCLCQFRHSLDQQLPSVFQSSYLWSWWWCLCLFWHS